MSHHAKTAHYALGLAGAGVANALAWLQSLNVGVIANAVTIAIGLVVWAYSRLRLSKSATDNKVWADRQKLERLERDKAARQEIRLAQLREKAEAKSLAARNAQLERRVADLEHALNESQEENVRRENREIEIMRRLDESHAREVALTAQMNRVEHKADTNARKIERLAEKSGEMPVVRPDDPRNNTPT